MKILFKEYYFLIKQGGIFLIKECVIIGMFGQERPIKLKMVDSLTILTGDNGSGKTTLLNIIFNVLNADFETLINIKFKEIKVIFEENSIKLDSITVQRTKHKLEIEYSFGNYSNIVLIERAYYGWNEYLYDFQEYLSENHIKYDEFDEFDEYTEYDEIDTDYQDHIDDLDSLIAMFPQLKYINEIKKALLYFPTYRRVDSDIKSLLEVNYLKNNPSFKNLADINKSINNFPNDRRVIGVGDEDIEIIYNLYSQELRQFNSTGLNELLKKFISSIITSIYSDTTSKRKKNKTEELKNAPTHLIELAEKLGIEDIDKEKVINYFGVQNKLRDNSSKIVQDAQLEVSVKQGRTGSPIIDIDNNTFKQILIESITSIGNKNNFVSELITLYREHLHAQEKELEPISYLKRGVNNFFKGKVSVELDEKTYSIFLSTPFKELSTGEKQLITILSYISLTLKRNAFRPLIIIDEPELSLHISWQNKLLPQLLEMNETRFLIATHSPYVANIKYRKHMKQLGEIDGIN